LCSECRGEAGHERVDVRDIRRGVRQRARVTIMISPVRDGALLVAGGVGGGVAAMTLSSVVGKSDSEPAGAFVAVVAPSLTFGRKGGAMPVATAFCKSSITFCCLSTCALSAASSF